MKQVLQNLKTGELEVAEVPTPVVKSGHLLIQTRKSLISSGTERMLVNFAKSSLIGKAKQQPDKVKQVIDKIKTDGLMPTLHSVFNRLDEPLPLGYCNCGTIIEVGKGVDGFAVGDRVISNGPHAEIVCAPKNLCAKVPENVSDEEAAFTVLASIGLQGIRLLKPAFGETIVVSGLGLIGLMAVQILKANGCRVIGIDLDKNKIALAQKYGAQTIDLSTGVDPIEAALAMTGGVGVDGVLITASAKKDSIVHQSAQMCRKRGRIILVGVFNLELDRSDFYEKELTFKVSCSYGPGRYDPKYENAGQDYPLGFVRWTEQRNFEAILNAMSAGTLKVGDLISERIDITQAQNAYKMLMDDPSKIALMLTYPQEQPELKRTVRFAKQNENISPASNVVVGVIGAGNFAKMTMLPVLKNSGVRLKTIADIDGVAGLHAAKKFGFENTTNDYKSMLEDSDINTVFITTRHDIHAKMIIEALQAGKNTHVEKPLCLNTQQLDEIKSVYKEHKSRHLFVGFNRRFSPHAQKIKQLVSSRTAPLCMNWLINAGNIPADVWIQDLNIGGGRVIGEGCHWIDFMSYIADASVVSVSAMMIGADSSEQVKTDKMSIILSFADGSIGTLHYFANGSKSYPKETFELFCQGKVLKLDNFRKLTGYGFKGFKKMNLWSQDKGHNNQFKAFIKRISEGGQPLISFEEIENVTLASFAAVQSAEGAGLINI
jgi:predicted dehydrogenase/NADPH:quinone reductase-like Zn-dependent oxidoreductase